MNKVKSFIFHSDWITDFEFLTDEEAGKLIKHLLAFACGCLVEVEKDERLIQFAFHKLKNVIQKDQNKYQEICDVRAENGRKGGLSSAKSKSYKQSKQMLANASKTKQVQHNSNSNTLNSKSNRDNSTLTPEIEEILKPKSTEVEFVPLSADKSQSILERLHQQGRKATEAQVQSYWRTWYQANKDVEGWKVMGEAYRHFFHHIGRASPVFDTSQNEEVKKNINLDKYRIK